ncbi:MAG: thiamine pyrophosphate-dependent enzyme, partial [Candidatus Zixiibacteriota bacterium]
PKFMCEWAPFPPFTRRRAAPDYKAIERAVELLKKSKIPLIIAGNGAIRKMASKHLRKFVGLTNIPVVSTFMGKGAVSDNDPQSLFTVGLQARDFVMCAIERADLIITIGYDIAEYAPEHWNREKSKKIIHIDFTPAEIYNYYQPDVEIVCDVSAALWELNEIVKRDNISFNPSWYQSLRTHILADFESYRLKEGDKFTVPGVLHIIRKLMNPGDLLISDVGSHKMWIGRNYPVYEPNSVIISNGLASMGIALPGGIAAKLAHPDRQVVAIMGDGGFMMNSQEIETARRIGVGFTMIVLNDNDYGLISWKQKSHTGRSTATALTNPDFARYAESFGIKGYCPLTLAEMESNLKEAITGQQLALVEIPIQPSVNYELTQKLNSNMCEMFKFE